MSVKASPTLRARRRLASVLACLVFLLFLEVTSSLSAAELHLANESTNVITNANDLTNLIAKEDCVGVSLNLEGNILWTGADELVLETSAGALRVEMDMTDYPTLKLGQRVRLEGFAMAGQGRLNAALADNDGLHSVAEQSGSVYLTAGLHPIRAEWFNGKFEYVFEVDYSGPQMARQPIPNDVLFHNETDSAGSIQWLPGLDYRCYEGEWEHLPHWRNWLPLKAGVTTNFDLSVRTRDQAAGIAFDGYLQVDHAGTYTFWTKSDDGSRLFIGNNPLRIETVGQGSLPAPREIKPGQSLKQSEDWFWASVEGTVTSYHIDPGGSLEVELRAGSGRMDVETEAGRIHPPELFSRIQVTGLCRNTRVKGGGYAAGRLLISSVRQIKELAAAPSSNNSAVNSLAELRELAASGQRMGCALCLTGIVITASSEQRLFAFQDQTGGILVQMDSEGDPVLPGQKIVLTGQGELDGDRLFMNHAALVDNNGLHLRKEKSGAIYLHAGKHPIHVSWFNRLNESSLDIYYQGPQISRQKIPASALIHPEIDPNTEDIKWVQGLDYKCYVGDWQNVPRVSRLDPVETGRVANFDIKSAVRSEKVGLEFNGYLDVPRDGQYFFSLISDDGSLLFIDEQMPHLQELGSVAIPQPQAISPRQILRPDQNNRWSEVEGTVDFVYEQAGSLFMELNSVYGPISVEVADSINGSPLLMLGSQVKVQGFCRGALVPAGQLIAANLIVPSLDQVQLLKNPQGQWSRYPMQTIKETLGMVSWTTNETIVHLQGKLAKITGERSFMLKDQSGMIDVNSLQPVMTNATHSVEVIGRLVRSETNLFLACGIYRNLTDSAADLNTNLPLLTTVQQVKQLSREQAQRGYPVKIHGVITLIRGAGSGFIIQDETSAIDVWWQPYANTSLPRIGDYWEVEGKTFREFSPNIRVSHAERLGVGTMPEPLHPAWDQLLNGSLDTRYVELQGIVIGTDSEGVTLLTRGGKLRVLLTPMPSNSARRYLDALVRIRGCMVPVRNSVSQQVQVGQLRLSNASINMDEPAPADPFETERKNVSDLLLFDARAGSLQRVKIVGQVLHVQGAEIYLTDGTNSFRADPRDEVTVQPGDLVEVVGFPELGGPSPMLREAILRRLNQMVLPAPEHLNEKDIFNKGHDGQLVSVEARLVGVGGGLWNKILELQSNNREFVARVDDRHDTLANLLPGSQLRLTGVYSEQTGNQPSGQQFTSFELLLNSPADVSVLERPPWWTPRRILMLGTGLIVLILAALFWIVLLRKKVEERSTQLAVEVRRREQAQRQNMLEKERTRIAKDMHDQLGTNVTQVSLLAELTKKNADDPERTADHIEKIRQKAFDLGRTLDEIVWAVNPKNDSLDKFCDYLAVQAQELFQLTNILCRVDLPPEMPRYPLAADVRHNLFLTTKEALNNVVRHAHAREVWIRFALKGEMFQISIVDDGTGFVFDPEHSRRNGLHNMKRRMEESGGNFEVDSRPTKGTRITLSIDLRKLQTQSPADTDRPA